MKFNISAPQRLFFFLLTAFICLIASSVIVYLLMGIGTNSTAMTRIAVVIQDVMMFILPAIVTAMIITRQSARFLMVDRTPSWAIVLLIFAIQIVAIPAMNAIISWNEGLHLSDSMQSIEAAMKAAEESAQATITTLIGTNTVGSLIIIILILGILAGFSEEIFFRGTLQRLLVTYPLNRHVAVWITAIIFSAIHMQFFGFFPRLLLGAFFGYLAVWTGNLWYPVIAHTLNNVMAGITIWSESQSMNFQCINEIGTTADIANRLICLTSIVATVALIVFLRHLTSAKQS